MLVSFEKIHMTPIESALFLGAVYLSGFDTVKPFSHSELAHFSLGEMWASERVAALQLLVELGLLSDLGRTDDEQSYYCLTPRGLDYARWRRSLVGG